MDNLVNESLAILSELGVPLAGLSGRRREKMAKAFLAVAGVRPRVPWSKALANHESGHKLISRQVIQFMNEHLGESISSGSYDDIRRKDLILPVAAGIVVKSAANPNANTNDGTRAYALSPDAAKQVSLFGTPQWSTQLSKYLSGQKTLSERLSRDRKLAQIPVKIKDGVNLEFSPGAHNRLQKDIIEQFLPAFGFGARVLYVGDTTDKDLFLDKEGLQELKFSEIAHDKLPDVVAYSSDKNWLYLIEAVTTANPISELRRLDLQLMCKDCSADIVFITAFPDRVTFRKHAKDIAWETEVWVADTPEHMIHFNGDKFLGPHKSS